MSEIKKICCACGIEKSIKSFYANRALRAGYEGRCKNCFTTRKRCRKRKEEIERKKRELYPSISTTTKEDWIETYEFLQKIGYDLSEDIHLQLCEKYGLKPRKRMREKTIQYSPSDLGMI